MGCGASLPGSTAPVSRRTSASLSLDRQDSFPVANSTQSSISIIIGNSEAPMIVCDSSGVITGLNGAAQTLLAVPSLEMIVGRTVDSLIPSSSPYCGMSHQGSIARAHTRGESSGMLGIGRHVTLQCLDGVVKPIWISVCKAVFPGSPPVVNYVGVLIDLSLKDAVPMRDRLQRCLAGASHDLKNVLTPLKLVFDLAEEQVEGKSVVLSWEDAVMCKEAVQSALAIINDAWSLSMQAEDRLILKKINLADVAQSAVSACWGLARQYNTTLEMKVAESIKSISYFADGYKLTRIFLNLIGNAIRFAPSGKVQLEITEAEEDTVAPLSAREHRIKFEVTDDGVGMIPEDVERVKGLYVHGSDSGSGVGLVVAEKCVGLMGSTLQLRSSIGKGTRVSFEVGLVLADG